MAETREKTVSKALQKQQGESNKRKRQISLPMVMHWMTFAGYVLALTLINSPVVMKLQYLPDVGEIAQKNIKADRDLLVEDKETTLKLRQEAAQAIASIYDWDGGMMDPVIRQIVDTLEWLQTVREEQGSQLNIAAITEEFSQRQEEEISSRLVQSLLNLDSLTALSQKVSEWLGELRNQTVVSGPETLKDLRDAPSVIYSIVDGKERKGKDWDKPIDLNGMRWLLGESMRKHLDHYPREIQEWLLRETRAMIRPNLVLNLAETRLKRQKAFDSIDTVFFQAKRGQMIVREGELVTEAARLKIEALNRTQWTGAKIMKFIGLAFILAIMLALGRWFLLTTSTAFPRDMQTIYMLASILLGTSFISTITLTMGQGITEIFALPIHMVVYLPHVALASALASLTVGARAGIPGGALILGVILSFLEALSAGGGLPLFCYYMIGSLMGGAKLRTSRRRFDVLMAGVWVGMIQMVTMPMVELLSGNQPGVDWILGMFMAMTSGLLMGLWGLALIPLLESVFNVTTDSRLLELASSDHPLLKELSLRSPGTYHHSVMMGNLAEAAAENINANPLMARVMALYHDIGKMTKPNYFVENQTGENRHDNLLPSMSAKVIMAHVKDGLELAKTHKLGGPIIEAILSHHGTSLLQFFYNKAINQAAKKGEYINPEEFRYPGPKPFSREAGILMLADSVEAAARTLRTPSSSQIQALVRRIIAGKIADDQLDTCGLNLKEVALIEEAFIRVLTLGFYHHRIEYPDQTKQRREGARREGNSPGKPGAVAVAKG
ncbi:MAG: HDIG domain-containing protein [Magnetococcales bacterium]|nr:HDIG domain-containing protein [Magnetococcales bacterium]MBF0148628.1 HDIG domain-containing protein [Magnetococcales bacterium]MBF0172732.1 HDIG domain-containing protein [Magnetococcales bacterium]MBF0346871.1 HDIG domain-containing protein [Magnetococcales bacterium]MBF0630870.1 HDIG domain-containing protein [Magnetococcales bacterium]